MSGIIPDGDSKDQCIQLFFGWVRAGNGRRADGSQYILVTDRCYDLSTLVTWKYRELELHGVTGSSGHHSFVQSSFNDEDRVLHITFLVGTFQSNYKVAVKRYYISINGFDADSGFGLKLIFVAGKYNNSKNGEYNKTDFHLDSLNKTNLLI
jgi:hypothetical protein